MNQAPLPISLLVEGVTDEVVVMGILEHVGLACGRVYGRKGKRYVLQRLPAYNQAARFSPWLVVVDLNHDAVCAPEFVRANLPSPAACMHLRVAVRALEAWLLADAERLATFLGISAATIPLHPDAQPDPKATLVQLAARSPRRLIREDMVPRQGSGARVGPGYVGRIQEFVTGTQHRWRPEVAASRSDSLRRCIAALDTLRACFDRD